MKIRLVIIDSLDQKKSHKVDQTLSGYMSAG